MPYNIDLHCHSWFSGDGVSSPEALIDSARKKGLHGFAMTDHNTCDACRYLLDKRLVREDGRPVEFAICYNRGDRYSLTTTLTR